MSVGRGFKTTRSHSEYDIVHKTDAEKRCDESALQIKDSCDRSRTNVTQMMFPLLKLY